MRKPNKANGTDFVKYPFVVLSSILFCLVYTPDEIIINLLVLVIANKLRTSQVILIVYSCGLSYIHVEWTWIWEKKNPSTYTTNKALTNPTSNMIWF